MAKFTKPAIMGKFLVYPYNDMNEKRWLARLEFMNMFFDIVDQSDDLVTGFIRKKGGEFFSRGHGETLGGAICYAAIGQNIDWKMIDLRIRTEQVWNSISHL